MKKPHFHLTLNDTIKDYLEGAKALGRGYDELAAQHALEISEHPELADGELAASVADIKAWLASLYFGHTTLAEAVEAIRGMWKDLPPVWEVKSRWGVEHHPQPWLIRNWLPRGELVLFTGKGGAGKSTLAIQLCIAMASGSEVWLPASNVMRVSAVVPRLEPGDWTCHIAGYEDNANQMELRARSILADDQQALTGLDDRLFFSREREPLWASAKLDEPGEPTGALNRLLDFAGERDLLVLDPAASVYAGNENDRAQVRAFQNHLCWWAEQTDTTIMVIAHPSKNVSENYAGSTDWQAAPRAFWSLVKEQVKDEDKVVVGQATKLMLEKSSYGSPYPASPAPYLVGPYPKWSVAQDAYQSATATRPEVPGGSSDTFDGWN